MIIPQLFWNDLRWGEEHHTELLKTYRDQWVAIKNKQVISAGKLLIEVQHLAKQKTGEELLVLFIDGGERIYAQIPA